MAGYSSTLLVKKLGVKKHFKIKVIGAPDNYFELFEDLSSIEIVNDNNIKKNFLHLFIKCR